MERKGSSFDMPLWENEGEALEPVSLNRERSVNVGRIVAKTEKKESEPKPNRMAEALRGQRERLRNLSDRDLARGVGAAFGAAMIGAITAPAHPIIGAGALAVAGAKAGEKLYEKFEAEYQRGHERERARHYRELEDYARAFENNAR